MVQDVAVVSRKVSLKTTSAVCWRRHHEVDASVAQRPQTHSLVETVHRLVLLRRIFVSAQRSVRRGQTLGCRCDGLCGFRSRDIFRAATATHGDQKQRDNENLANDGFHDNPFIAGLNDESTRKQGRTPQASASRTEPAKSIGSSTGQRERFRTRQSEFCRRCRKAQNTHCSEC